MKGIAVLATLFLVGYVASYPTVDPSGTTSEVGLVLAADGPSDPKKEKTKENEKPESLQLRSMNVDSNVTNRYAHTVISSRYANPADVSQEATFSVVLPDTAFISGFVMIIKDKEYKAYVEEKKEAKRIYDEAVASGFGAAHVAADTRDSNRFTVSMNVEPHSKVIFNLSYEQLLQRKNGKYEMIVNLHPGQLVKDLTVDVHLNETRPLIKVSAPALRSGNEVVEDTDKKNEIAVIELGKDKTIADIHFAPTIEQQKEMAEILQKDKSVDNGISGQFVIEYDVERDPSGGEVIVSDDGYFVHFFAPNQLKPIPKHVVFVLDVSGSMWGKKMEQLKEAMQVILKQLNPSDFFNLVEFSSAAKVWNIDKPSASFEYPRWLHYNQKDEEALSKQELPPAYPATPENIAKAKKIVEEMAVHGGTNIYDALEIALNVTNERVHRKFLPTPIIIFLTDGEATEGKTSSNEIIERVDSLNTAEEKTAIFALAFGFDTNTDLLKKISLKNSGFMRQIYEAGDASLQLQDFYKSISSPLLSNVKFDYSAVEDDSLTKNKFNIFFDGGELIVAGKFKKGIQQTGDLAVHGLTVDGPIDFPPHIIKWVPRPTAVGQLERLWAYMSIRQLLDEAATKDEKEPLEKKRALALALKYSFVTPVTSLVVVKPNETKSVDTEEAQSNNNFNSRVPVLGSAGGFIGGLAGGNAMSFALSGVPGPVFAAPPKLALHHTFAPQPALAFDRFDSDIEPESLPTWTTKHKTTSYTPTILSTSVAPINITINIYELPWLNSIKLPTDDDILTIDNKTYHIGNNATVVETKPCQVAAQGLSGNCTLISACPSIYPKLTDLDTYKQYFCTLESDKYAGVCCVEA